MFFRVQPLPFCSALPHRLHPQTHLFSIYSLVPPSIYACQFPLPSARSFVFLPDLPALLHVPIACLTSFVNYLLDPWTSLSPTPCRILFATTDHLAPDLGSVFRISPSPTPYWFCLLWTDYLVSNSALKINLFFAYPDSASVSCIWVHACRSASPDSYNITKYPQTAVASFQTSQQLCVTLQAFPS